MIKIMIKRIATLIGLTVCLFLVGTPVMAEARQTTDPYQLMQQVVDTTFKRIAKDHLQISQNPNHLKIIVADELMPYFDHRYASRIILHKIKASKQQKKAFYRAFEQYLVTTYATVFAKYTDQKVVFEPPTPFDGKKKVVVKTRLVSEGLPDINIDFRVRKIKKSGHWKAYDMRALGISLLDAKKAELSGLLRKENGVNSVTQLLTDKAKADIMIDREIGRL